MSQLTDNLNLIASIKSDIKSAIESKGVDMTGVSFGSFAAKIGEITTSFVTVPLSVSANGTYNPGQGVDGFSQVVVDVPQSVEGYTEKQVTEGDFGIVNLNNSASFVRNTAFAYDSNLMTVNLPNCETIGDNAFRSCRKLSYVSIPACKTISTNAFSSCGSITSIDLPVCEDIQGYAFYFGYSLVQVSVPNVTSLGNYAFGYCSMLSEISLPVVSSIGNYCFQNCSSLQTLTLCTETYKMPAYQNRMFSNTGSFMTNGSIYVASDMYSRWIVSTGWSSLSSLFVSVNQSGPVLSYDSGLVSGITRYLDASFSTYLSISKSDVLGLSLSNIEVFPNYFANCPNLSTISLQNTIEVKANAFQNCYSLSEINLPVCKIIRDGAFTNCSALSEVTLPACESISNCFRICSYLESVTLPACVNLGNYTFSGCSSLSDVSIPVCEYIGNNCFDGCIALSRIALPVCSYLASYAFYNCTSLSEVILGYSSVCEFPGAAFANMTWSILKIYVPSSLVEDYKAAHITDGMSSYIYPIPE